MSKAEPANTGSAQEQALRQRAEDAEEEASHLAQENDELRKRLAAVGRLTEVEPATGRARPWPGKRLSGDRGAHPG